VGRTPPDVRKVNAMNRWFPLLLAISLLFGTVAAEDPPAAPKKTPVDHAKRGKRTRGMLGTSRYRPSAAEKPWYDKLPAKERITGSFAGEYEMLGKKGMAVGWFGIVRKIDEDEKKGTTALLVDMKYFDGLVDSHVQIVSIHGAGDFRARLDGTKLGIGKLSLVRIYGTVTSEKEGVPDLKASFVRHWDWGHFSFMAYGPPKGKPAWRKLNRVPDDDVYSPGPDERYYELRIGPRKGKILFDRLGGKASIDKLAADLAKRLKKNAKLVDAPGKIRSALEATDEKKLAEGLAAWMTYLAGGTLKFAGPHPVRLDVLYDPRPEQWQAACDDLEACLKSGIVPKDPAWDLCVRAWRTFSRKLPKDDD
jgi:hypothetical protein